MLNIVLFGPPGAGKGTQSQKLIDKYGLVHLSTGDILRSEIARGTTLGLEAKKLMDDGILVGDDIVIGMIESKLDENPHANGFIFDGFPRTQAQAIALDDLLQKKGTSISAMLALEVSDEELIKRLLLRGQESGRPDDANEEVIRKRVNEYNNKTLPLKNYYSEQGKFHSIYGIGTIEGIFKALCDRITFVKAEVELTMLENDIAHLDLTVNDFEEATEISDELKQDIEEVRKTEVKKSENIPSAAETTINKTAKASVKKATKKVTKAPAKKVSKPAKKAAVKKAVKKVAKPVKKVAKKTVSKKVVKKVAPKGVAKKTVKKVAPKKAVKKVVVRKKVAPKKVVKKLNKKIALKKVAPKKAAPKKKLVAKKAVKEVVAKKKIAPKKAANKKKK